MLLSIFSCASAFWLRDSLSWSLAERRGLLLGITEYQLGSTFTAASLLGLAGPLAANYLGMRLGRVRTVMGGLVVIGIVMQVIAMAASPLPYRAGFLLWPAVSIFAWTYVMATAATLDPNGRVAAICGGLTFAASACGPGVGGVLFEWHDGNRLPIVILLLTIATLLSAYPVVRRLSLIRTEPQ
jgi:MFS family permease